MKKILLSTAGFLVLIGCVFVYFLFHGMPWELQKQRAAMQKYLNAEYNRAMVVDEVSYDFTHGNYHGKAYPAKNPELRFHVGFYKDIGHYTDAFRVVLWRHEVNQDLDEKAMEIFGKKLSGSAEFNWKEQVEFQTPVRNYRELNIPFEIGGTVKVPFDAGKCFRFVQFVKQNINATRIDLNFSNESLSVTKKQFGQISSPEDLIPFLQEEHSVHEK